MRTLFSLDFGSLNFMQSPNMIEVSLILFKIVCIIMMSLCTHITFLILIHVAANQNHKSELIAFGVCFSLVSYLYVLATKKSMRFQVSNTWSLTFAKKMWFSSGACCKLNFHKWKSGVTNDGAEGLVLMSKSLTLTVFATPWICRFRMVIMVISSNQHYKWFLIFWIQ